ncbi:MAG: 30S ribosomal protein S12 methylthiotransferase RimO [Verrucomicrobia bacterium]|nr:30S ribosomal protein S12 methylthiotransferase RimO [Verrucomicrobiota bacterium]MBS0647268.1 30S ribosomal protein S12 methylthiotransferase RimO [Verrucomicrobiota bacterium]
MSYSLVNYNKIHFVSLGCPRNLVDSEVMLGILLKAGYEVTPDVALADYLVVNTCAFLEASRQESKDVIQDLLNTKKKDAKLIVTGCMVSKHREEIERLFPGVHYLLGSGDVEGILKAVRDDTSGSVIGSVKSYLEAGEIPRQLSTPNHYAYLKIAEGCRKACAYCIIPKLKGPLRSKTVDQILKEFKALLSRGVKEVILIAQDLGDYGKEKGAQQGTLAELLKQILQIPGEYWLRLLYLYPDEIDDEMIALMKSDPRICPYLDMPIQHVNDTILKQMRRHTDKAQILSVIQKLREQLPSVHVRTSLIVGFPGETPEQFEELKKFVKEHPLDHIGIFTYSKEEGTVAAQLPDQVAEDIKQQRRDELAKIQQEVSLKLNRKRIGQHIEVVVEGYHPETDLLLVGRHQGQAPEIDGTVILNDWSKVTAFGERYLVEITDVSNYDLIGRVLKPVKQKLKII